MSREIKFRGRGQDAVDETALLVWDMARRGKVGRRDGGVYGVDIA